MPFSSPDPNADRQNDLMERFCTLGNVMKLAHRVADYCRTQRHLIRAELKRLSADYNGAALAPA